MERYLLRITPVKIKMKKIIFFFIFIISACSSYKEEVVVANTILLDPKYRSKNIDLISKAESKKDHFPELKIYLKYLENAIHYRKSINPEFYFEIGYENAFTPADINFISDTEKQDFSWKGKILTPEITLVEQPVFETVEKERKFIENMILKDHPLCYMSKPYFNRFKNKAIISFYALNNYVSYFLVKENNSWKVIGVYQSQML